MHESDYANDRSQYCGNKVTVPLRLSSALCVWTVDGQSLVIRGTNGYYRVIIERICNGDCEEKPFQTICQHVGMSTQWL